MLVACGKKWRPRGPSSLALVPETVVDSLNLMKLIASDLASVNPLFDQKPPYRIGSPVMDESCYDRDEL